MRHRFASPEVERSTIVSALREADGNIGTAAHQLGSSRRTLQNRMRLYGLPRGRAGRRKRPLPYGRKRTNLLTGLGIGAAAILGAGLVARKLTEKA